MANLRDETNDSTVVRRLLTLFLIVVAFSAGGVLLESQGAKPPSILPHLLSATIVLVGVSIAVSAFANLARVALGASAIFAVGAVSELAGLYYGFPFGRYVYTEKWQPVLELPGGHFFPLLLPFAWVMIVLSCLSLFSPSDRSTRVFAAALCAAAFDFAMEPAMIGRLGYWKWLGYEGEFAPVSNFMGWFAVSALAGLVFTAISPEPKASGHAGMMLAGYAAFLAILSLQIPLAAALLAVYAVTLWWFSRSRPANYAN